MVVVLVRWRFCCGGGFGEVEVLLSLFCYCGFVVILLLRWWFCCHCFVVVVVVV